MEKDSNKILELFTDGSCLSNPGPGGWAVLFKGGKNEILASGGEKQTTNNRMELMATIKGLQLIMDYVQNNGEGNKKETVKCTLDSKYVKNGIEIWSKNWIANNWRTASGKEVKNKDLWQDLSNIVLDLKERVILSWHWTKGHAGHSENEKVDREAQRVANIFKNQL